MAYTDFTLELAENSLGVYVRPGVVFDQLTESPVPTWLASMLELSLSLALVSEKARSEFLVAPILLATRQAVQHEISILSGQRLDVDPERQLVGECDFLLAQTEPVPRLRGPLMTIVEAKRNDVEAGLGQCIAQMVAAQIFNEREGQPREYIYGCVTTGENWQFLSLHGTDVLLHRTRYYIADIGLILAAFIRAMTCDTQRRSYLTR